MNFFNFLKSKELNRIKELDVLLSQSIQSNIVHKEENKTAQEEISKLNNDINKLTDKYSKIIDLESESEKLELNIAKLKERLNGLNDQFKKSLETYKSLKREISLFETKIDIAEYGIYDPVYDFEKSDDYRREQDLVIAEQKAMVQLGNAAKCLTEWTIDGSLTKGRASTKKYIKLILRAFNGEADAIISKVKWNNVVQLQLRLNQIYLSLNRLGENQTVYITEEYFQLKNKELQLEYEYQLKKQKEKEEQRALIAELREEEKVRRELEKAQRDAEKEEAYYLKVLEKVKQDYSKSIGDPSELMEKIAKLELDLEEARLKKERALSMAQQTKMGYVYIISNIGAFGDNVFKIGMTRRLDPMDRVRELGDASVPFKFDVHAMIYSEEARILEYELHKAFADKAINLFNFRKEFFKVSIEDIENKVKELGFKAEFSKEPEAEEYKETIAIKERSQSKIDLEIEESFYPEDLIKQFDE